MEATYDLNTEKDASRNFTVLVTGFAPWAGSRVNPSELLASRLPSSIHFKGGNITIAKLDSPIPVSYAAISGDVPPIIEKIKPDVVLHVGVDTSEFTAFHLERGASRDGYNSIPDATRRVFTKAEAKIKYGKSPDFLTTSLDVSSIFERWNNGLLQTNHSSPIRRVLGPEVIITEDAGDFVCGFLYYQSLEYFNSLKRSGELARPVLFLHVPQFGDDEDELVKGDFILLRLIEAIAHVYGQNS
ncbi:peptidase C15, pyroglutamyl peptidase I-like protein [Tothia fuscella]|uniref:Peptidase C15, pyroglutamyl peptidase I-like protein n=1 Tax=Tothia fuscella TaxID=1048955 RepID=A0A9P4NHN1_9PEZI|nr:peptidase C15, pyroglutamyl peptidase I-like protein [Tothia fuscella]